MKTIQIILLIFLWGWTMSAHAQDPPQSAKLMSQRLSTPQLVDGQTLTQAGVVLITLPTSGSVKNYHITLGSTEGGTDLFDGVFSDASSELPSDQRFRHVGNQVMIQTGWYSDSEFSTSVYLQVRLEYTTGTLSTPVSFTYQP